MLCGALLWCCWAGNACLFLGGGVCGFCGSQAAFGRQARQPGKQKAGQVRCRPQACLVHQGGCHGGVDAARQRADHVVGGAHLRAGARTGGQQKQDAGGLGVGGLTSNLTPVLLPQHAPVAPQPGAANLCSQAHLLPGPCLSPSPSPPPSHPVMPTLLYHPALPACSPAAESSPSPPPAHPPSSSPQSSQQCQTGSA